MKVYTTHLRHCTLERGVDVVSKVLGRGLVLVANDHWCTLVLPRSGDERGRLAALARRNPAGVLLLDVGGVGARVWWHQQRLERLDTASPDAWSDTGLVPRELVPSIGARGLEDTDWGVVLGLPEPWQVTDRLLQAEQIDVVGAVPVGLEMTIAEPAPEPVVPEDPAQLFAMLTATGSVVVGGDAAALAERFGRILEGGPDGETVLAWLLEQPETDEVFVGAPALQVILDAMRLSRA